VTDTSSRKSGDARRARAPYAALVREAVAASIDDGLGRVLAALPGRYRMIVVLHEVERLSTREVAEVTGISEANVKTRLHRARTMLRRHLEGM
jgi:RNA polymerase sigma factor (sigma-70 family)